MPYSTKSQMTYVDYRDVAETAAIAMTGSRLDNSTFELAAPGMVNTTTIAALFASELGRPVEAARSGFEAWASRAGIPEGPLRNGLARMSADYDAHGFHGGNSLVLETILGRSPRSLGAYIREMVGAGKLVVARVWMLISTRSRYQAPVSSPPEDYLADFLVAAVERRGDQPPTIR